MLRTAFAASTLYAIPAPAIAREKAAAFTIGILGTREPPELALKTLRRTMERAASRAVAFELFARGERLVEAAATGRITLSVHTALTFAAARIACDCLVPLARPVTADGTAGIRSVVFVRSDAAIRRTPQLAGRAILGGSDPSVSARVGRIALRHRLKDHPAPLFIEPSAGPDLERFVGGAGDALIGHEAVDRWGQVVEGSGTWADLPDASAFAALWRSAPIWHGPVALHQSHDNLRARMNDALMSMPSAGAETIGLGLGRVSLAPARLGDYDLLPLLLRADQA